MSESGDGENVFLKHFGFCLTLKAEQMGVTELYSSTLEGDVCLCAGMIHPFVDGRPL